MKRGATRWGGGLIRIFFKISTDPEVGRERRMKKREKKGGWELGSGENDQAGRQAGEVARSCLGLDLS